MGYAEFSGTLIAPNRKDLWFCMYSSSAALAAPGFGGTTDDSLCYIAPFAAFLIIFVVFLVVFEYFLRRKFFWYLCSDLCADRPPARSYSGMGVACGAPAGNVGRPLPRVACARELLPRLFGHYGWGELKSPKGTGKLMKSCVFTSPIVRLHEKFTF